MKIEVEVRAEAHGQRHLKYGVLVRGEKIMIDEEDFGDQLFTKIAEKEAGKVKLKPQKDSINSMSKEE